MPVREITGFSNPLVKQVRSLRDKKHRRAEGRFLAEGLRILTEALDAGIDLRCCGGRPTAPTTRWSSGSNGP